MIRADGPRDALRASIPALVAAAPNSPRLIVSFCSHRSHSTSASADSGVQLRARRRSGERPEKFARSSSPLLWIRGSAGRYAVSLSKVQRCVGRA
jgi:hypothetical protein